MPVELKPHQQDVLPQIKNGRILYGSVGSGKTYTALAYYLERERTRDVFVITTAKKRDSLDWQRTAAKFGIGGEPDATLAGVLTVDSWNNIGNYLWVEDAFFIFDEQRVVGHGHWVKTFIKLARKNRWILLSGTPGDSWMDYAPVFVANGWYNSLSEFKREHVIYEPFVKYPKIKGYIHEDKLEYLRNKILVEMVWDTSDKRRLNYLPVVWDHEKVREMIKTRWHPYEDRPLIDVSELWRVARKICWSDPSRVDTIRELMKYHPKLIVFYTYNYELELLRELSDECVVAEWNGHRKQLVPDTERWVYLVQYTSGSEGWNCVDTDAMVLYSLTYSYKNYMQAQGRIDRLNSPFDTLYYYILFSDSVIDQKVRNSLNQKQNFNERDGYSALVNSLPVK